MALPIKASPLTTRFDFHDISEAGAHFAVVRCLPADTIPQPPIVDVGALRDPGPGVHVKVFVNAGRLGTPGVEIGIESHYPTFLNTSVIFEPGLSGSGTASNRYRLDSVRTAFLGKAGGGGHHYDQDPDTISQAPLADRKRILKMEIDTYNYTCTSRVKLRHMLHRLPAGSPEHELLVRMTTGERWQAKIYFILPDSFANLAYQNTIIEPLQTAIRLRVPPFHQYLQPANVLNFDIATYTRFRKSMYCNPKPLGSASHDGSPIGELAPIRGRDTPLPVAVVTSVGVLREVKSHETYCRELGIGVQGVRFVRSTNPLLWKGTPQLANCRGLRDFFLYLGYIKVMQPISHTLTAPFPGTIFGLKVKRAVAGGGFEFTGEICFGIVLEATALALGSHSNFVMALRITNETLKSRCVFGTELDIGSILLERAQLTVMNNLSSGKQRLTALRTFGVTNSLNQTVRGLQSKLLSRIQFQQLQDLRVGPDRASDPSVYTAFIDGMSTLPEMANLSAQESGFLSKIPRKIDRHSVFIRSDMEKMEFRCIVATILGLTTVGHRVIIALENIDDRAHMCWMLNEGCRIVFNGMPAFKDEFGNRRVLAWTSTEIEVDEPLQGDAQVPVELDLSHPSNSRRLDVELYFKNLVDDLPSHNYAVDKDQQYFTSAPFSPPPGMTPFERSMTSAKYHHWQSNPAGLTQGVNDRADSLNGTAMTTVEAKQCRARLQTLERTVLSQTHILVSNHSTLMNQVVVDSFEKPVVVIIGAEHSRFDMGGALLLRHENYVAAFIVGNPEDTRRPAPRFASRGNNEAWDSFNRSMWRMAVGNGVPTVNLM